MTGPGAEIEFGKIGEGLVAAGVEGMELEARAGQRRDAAGGENLQREVEREGAGMKQVERPKIDGAACEIGAAGSVGGDDGSRRLGSSRHAMFLSRRRIERSDGGHVEDVQREAKEKSADGTTGSRALPKTIYEIAIRWFVLRKVTSSSSSGSKRTCLHAQPELPEPVRY